MKTHVSLIYTLIQNISRQLKTTLLSGVQQWEARMIRYCLGVGLKSIQAPIVSLSSTVYPHCSVLVSSLNGYEQLSNNQSNTGNMLKLYYAHM